LAEEFGAGLKLPFSLSFPGPWVFPHWVATKEILVGSGPIPGLYSPGVLGFGLSKIFLRGKIPLRFPSGPGRVNGVSQPGRDLPGKAPKGGDPISLIKGLILRGLRVKRGGV